MCALYQLSNVILCVPYIRTSDWEPTWYFQGSSPLGRLLLHLQWSCWKWSPCTPEQPHFNASIQWGIHMYGIHTTAVLGVGINTLEVHWQQHTKLFLFLSAPWLSWFWPLTPPPLSRWPQWWAACRDNVFRYYSIHKRSKRYLEMFAPSIERSAEKDFTSSFHSSHFWERNEDNTFGQDAISKLVVTTFLGFYSVQGKLCLCWNIYVVFSC